MRSYTGEIRQEMILFIPRYLLHKEGMISVFNICIRHCQHLLVPHHAISFVLREQKFPATSPIDLMVSIDNAAKLKLTTIQVMKKVFMLGPVISLVVTWQGDYCPADT